MDLLHILAAAIVIHATYTCLRSGLLVESYRLAAAIRPRHVVANLPALSLTVAVAWCLHHAPGFDVGWTDFVGGEGNIMLGQRSDDSTPMFTVAVVLVVTGLMPVLARIEEQVFRAGSERRNRRHRLAVGFGFGLVHLVAGIPLGSAIALTVAGLWFTNRYLAGYRRARNEGLDRQDSSNAALDAATIAHLAWNWTIVSFLAVSVIA